MTTSPPPLLSPSTFSSAVTGGPAEWATATQALDVVRAAAANRDARVVVAVFGRGGEEEVVAAPVGSDLPAPSPPSALPEDRLAGLCRQGCIDPVRVITLSLDEGAAGLRRLGRTLGGAAGEHYAADAGRRVAACAARATAAAADGTPPTPTPPPPAAVGRAALKAGALAEFRGDWGGAAREYLASHSALVAAAGLERPPPQRLRELGAVAEVAATKAATLLHHQRRPGEAARLVAAHVAAFGVRAACQAAGVGRPADLPPGVAADAFRWAARQHAMAGGLVSARVSAAAAAAAAAPSTPPPGSSPPPLPPPAAASPAAAARALTDAARAEVAAAAAARRAAVASPAPPPPGTPPPPAIVPGAYLGQLVSLGPPPRRLSDCEWAACLGRVAAAGAADTAAAALARLKAARVAAVCAGRAARREGAQVSVLVAREQLLAAAAGGGGEGAWAGTLDTSAAADLAAAAAVFRAEGWAAPLADALTTLADVSARAGRPADAAAAALEAAGLEGGLGGADRGAVAAAFVAALDTPPPPPPPHSPCPPLELRVGEGGYPGLASSIALWASFDDGRGGGGGGGAPALLQPSTGTAGAPAILWLGLASNLPVPLPVASMEVEVLDAVGRATLAATPLLSDQKPPKPAHLAPADGGRPSTCHSFTLAPAGPWTALAAAWTPRAPGSVRLVAVRAWLGGKKGGGGTVLAWHAQDWALPDQLARVPVPVGGGGSLHESLPASPHPAARSGGMRGMWARRGAPAARSGGGAAHSAWEGTASQTAPAPHLARAPLCIGARPVAAALPPAPPPFHALASRLGGGVGSGAGAPPWAASPSTPAGLWEAEVSPAGGPPWLTLLGPATILAGEATPVRVWVTAPAGGTGLAAANVRVAVVDAVPGLVGGGGGGGSARLSPSPPRAPPHHHHHHHQPLPSTPSLTATTTLAARPPANLVRGPADPTPLRPDHPPLDLGPIPPGGAAWVDVAVVLDHPGAAAEVEATLCYWAAGGRSEGEATPAAESSPTSLNGPAAAVRASATLVASAPLTLARASLAGPPLTATLQRRVPRKGEGAGHSSAGVPPPTPPLPTGEACVVTTTLLLGGGGGSGAPPPPCPPLAITVLSVDLAPTPGVVAVPALAAPGVGVVGGCSGKAPPAGTRLGPGDELTSLFGVRRDDFDCGRRSMPPLPDAPESLGDLVVTWARAAPPALVPLPPGAGAVSQAGAAAAGAEAGAATAPPGPPADVGPPSTTALALPAVTWAPSRLTARLAWPAGGGGQPGRPPLAPPPHMGAPLALSLAITTGLRGEAAAASSPSGRLALTVADAPGFVIASRRRGWVALLPPPPPPPHDGGGAHHPPPPAPPLLSELETITLIPHAAGPLALPAISLALEDVDGGGGEGEAGSVGCCLTAAGAGVLVRPAEEE